MRGRRDSPYGSSRQGQPLTVSDRAGRRTFQLILIKPSHYDDDGYVIRWWRAMIPSNSLAALYGIAADCAEREVLGPDVAIDITAIDETNTRVDVPRLVRGCNATAISAWWRWSACNPTSIRAHSTSPGRSAKPACRSSWAAFTSPAASRCSTAVRSGSTRADDLGISPCSPARPRAGSTRCCAMPPRGELKPLYNFMKDLPGIEERRSRSCRRRTCAAYARPLHQLRRRPRLSLPVLVLHHHQRAGTQVALSHGRRRRAAGADELGARRPQVLHHRRQFRAQQGIGKRSSTG